MAHTDRPTDRRTHQSCNCIKNILGRQMYCVRAVYVRIWMAWQPSSLFTVYTSQMLLLWIASRKLDTLVVVTWMELNLQTAWLIFFSPQLLLLASHFVFFILLQHFPFKIKVFWVYPTSQFFWKFDQKISNFIKEFGLLGILNIWTFFMGSRYVQGT